MLSKNSEKSFRKSARRRLPSRVRAARAICVSQEPESSTISILRSNEARACNSCRENSLARTGLYLRCMSVGVD